MKIKILIAILAAAMMAYAGSARAQWDLLGHITEAGCVEEGLAKHLAIKETLPEYPGLKGKFMIAAHWLVFDACAMMSAKTPALDKHKEIVGKTYFDAIAVVKIPAAADKVFKAFLGISPEEDCLRCECGGKEIPCEYIKMCTRDKCAIEDPENCVIPDGAEKYCGTGVQCNKFGYDDSLGLCAFKSLVDNVVYCARADTMTCLVESCAYVDDPPGCTIPPVIVDCPLNQLVPCLKQTTPIP